MHCKRRQGAFATLAICLVWLVAGAAAAGLATSPAAAAPWSPVQWPGGAGWAVHDAVAFGSVGLAAAGDGHLAVSRDAGRTWRVAVPAGHATTAFTAIAFNSSGSGVVASGGLLLVTNDWGATWTEPAVVGQGSGAAISDVAMRGARAVAVGHAGTILTSWDSGATWEMAASPTGSALTSVAVAGDGTAVAGAASGEILAGTTTWSLAGTAAGPVSAVAASSIPTWGDGLPDLFASTGNDVLGSDDALTFASLAGLPDLSTQAWPALAWAGLPDRSLVIAGAEEAGFFDSTPAWLPGSTGLNGVAVAFAPGSQSVAYLLGVDGRLVRTLSAGRDPAAVSLTKSRIVVGGTTRLTAAVRVAAPGTALLRSRVPGRAWTTIRRIPWTTADWDRRVSFDLSPSLNHEYVVEFEYGGTTVRLAPVTRVVVEPKVATARSRYVLGVGDVFRFSGTVAPKLGGERVELYTDRGGSWRPVSLQRSVTLRDGRSWRSRMFGTPKAETYHLRARVPATRTHAGAWSRIVTVTIR